MRLTPEQIKVFGIYARRYFGEDAELWLFGSRVDDAKKGGDYDFLVETTLFDADEIIQRKIILLTKLQGTAQFEDEKIDIVVKRRTGTFEMPIYQVAKHDGVRI
jgi:predicted nucleotidyltransferase